MQHRDIRFELETSLGHEVPDKLWDYLSRLGFVEDVEVGATDVSGLVSNARDVIGAGTSVGKVKRAGRVKSPMETDVVEALRRQAVSLLIAQHAGRQDRVIRFRRAFVEGPLLKIGEVEEWLYERSKGEGNPDSWQAHLAEFDSGRPTVELPPLLMDRSDLLALATSDENDDLLAYAMPGSDTISYIFNVDREGPLRELIRLNRYLAALYSWTEFQALLFVLTGEVPLVETLSVAIEPNWDEGLEVSARIKLSIDITMTPDQLKARYKLVRDELLSSRYRSLSEKSLTLVQFIALLGEGVAWRERMELWNSRYPGWLYVHESNFRRDALAAKSRLLKPGYQFDGLVYADEPLFESELLRLED